VFVTVLCQSLLCVHYSVRCCLRDASSSPMTTVCPVILLINPEIVRHCWS